MFYEAPGLRLSALKLSLSASHELAFLGRELIVVIV
jgi:hypothetical protein